MNRVLVTGSSGFVGNILVGKLKDAGYDVIEADTKNGIDITDWKTFSAAIPKVRAVFHLAARIFVPDSYKDPLSFYQTNLLGTLHALEICRKFNARMILASSYIYGHPQYLPIDENHPVAAFNPYAQTKLMSEELCHAYYRDFGIHSTILRPFNIYGPGQPDSFLIPSIIKQIFSGKVVLESPHPKRDFVFAEDVADAYICAAQTEEQGCGTYNIASGKSSSVGDVVKSIIEHSGLHPFVEYTGSTRPNDVMDTVGNIELAQEKLGWKPSVTFEDGVQKCIEAFNSK